MVEIPFSFTICLVFGGVFWRTDRFLSTSSCMVQWMATHTLSSLFRRNESEGIAIAWPLARWLSRLFVAHNFTTLMRVDNCPSFVELATRFLQLFCTLWITSSPPPKKHTQSYVVRKGFLAYNTLRFVNDHVTNTKFLCFIFRMLPISYSVCY